MTVCLFFSLLPTFFPCSQRKKLLFNVGSSKKKRVLCFGYRGDEDDKFVRCDWAALVGLSVISEIFSNNLMLTFPCFVVLNAFISWFNVR